MKLKIVISACLVMVAAVIAVGISMYLRPVLISRNNSIFSDNDSLVMASDRSSRTQHSERKTQKPPPVISPTVFIENFDTSYTVVEAGSMSASKSLLWWVSSGAYFYSVNGIGSTIIGELPTVDPWRVAFYLANPGDTDDGYHPQNIFRLVTKSRWQNFRQETYFRIQNDNLSTSVNRNASNGLLFFNRYQDENTLYYTGIRVDGAAVIKKKVNGTYVTLAYKPFFAGSEYNRDVNPNLLPKNVWIGLRSEVKTDIYGKVNIKVYVDNGKTGNWVLAAEATDDGKSSGGAAILNEGYAGIRTDFMDVEFDDYRATKL